MSIVTMAVSRGSMTSPRLSRSVIDERSRMSIFVMGSSAPRAPAGRLFRRPRAASLCGRLFAGGLDRCRLATRRLRLGFRLGGSLRRDDRQQHVRRLARREMQTVAAAEDLARPVLRIV